LNHIESSPILPETEFAEVSQGSKNETRSEIRETMFYQTKRKWMELGQRTLTHIFFFLAPPVTFAVLLHPLTFVATDETTTIWAINSLCNNASESLRCCCLRLFL
jgi:hypothetical protein